MATGRPEYYRRLLWEAISHGWGWAETAAAIFGLLSPLVLESYPDLKDQMADYIWQATIGVLVVVSATRLLASPYRMYRQLEDEKIKADAQNATLRNEIDRLQRHRTVLPATVQFRQAPTDRDREWRKEKQAQREIAKKREGSEKLMALRQSGLQLAANINAEFGHPDKNTDFFDELVAWLDQIRACVTEYVSPSRAEYVVTAPFDRAQHGFAAWMRPHLVPYNLFQCVNAVLKRLDELLGDY